MNSTIPASLRIHPASVLEPLPLAACFSDPARPVEVDMGCGKGRFLLAHARRNPGVNFLGVDRMLGRLRKVEAKALRAGLDNVRLLRMDAFYAAMFLIPPAAVSAYYVFFPDPWPKARHERHRLFNPDFMNALVRTLQPGGLVHVATDHLPYYEAILSIFAEDRRFEAIAPFYPAEEERSDFELMFRGTKPYGRASYRRTGSA